MVTRQIIRTRYRLKNCAISQRLRQSYGAFTKRNIYTTPKFYNHIDHRLLISFHLSFDRLPNSGRVLFFSNLLSSHIPTDQRCEKMPKAPLLRDDEKAAILAHHHHGMTIKEIAETLGRSRDAISRFLRNPHPQNQPKWKARNQKLSPTTVRRIIREASRTKKSASQIKQDLELNVTERRIQQIQSGTEYLKYMKSMKAPAMTDHHRKKRVDFANEMLGFYHPDWTKVVFTNEKQFHLDGPDGLNCYWHDLRKEPEQFFTRQQGGDSIMVWGGISFYGSSELEGIQGTQDSERYCKVLETTFIPWAAVTCGEEWVLQHDGASTHQSNYTKNYLKSKKVEVLPWPAKSPDLNIIENVWVVMARKVYEDGRQFSNVEELGEKNLDAWDSFTVEYLEKLYESLSKRFF